MQKCNVSARSFADINMAAILDVTGLYCTVRPPDYVCVRDVCSLYRRSVCLLQATKQHDELLGCYMSLNILIG